MDVENVLLIEDDFFKRLNSLILDNMDNPDYTLDALCKDCLLSRSQLHRKLKDQTGLSASIYIRKVKLSKAKELLVNSDLSISEIAWSTGFNSPQSLSRYFSSEFGSPPSQFKHQLTQEIEQPADIENYSATIKQNENQHSDEDKEVDLNDDQAQKQMQRTHLYWKAFTLIPAILFLVFWGSQQYFKKNELSKTETLQEYKNSIAVLPLDNFGGADAQQFSAGMQDDILTKLAVFEDLKVISRTSTEAYTETDKSLKQIAAELDVAYILEGSVRLEGNQVAVTAQLIKASDDTHVWAENYVEELDNVFQIQNEIALQIAKVLNQKITTETKAEIIDAYQPGREAYKEFLIGKELLKERTHSSILASIDHLNRVLDMEPDFVDALVLMATAYNLLGNIGYDRLDEHIVTSDKFALKALRLDPKNAQAYAIQACSHRDSHRWEQGKLSFEIALEHNPNDALINYWYSLLLREIGEIEKAILYSSRARELDPLYPVIHGGHVVNLAYGDDPKQAVDVIENGEILFKQSFLHHWAKALYAESIFNYQSAIDAFEKVLEINPELNSVQRGIYFNKARLGHIEDVNAYLSTIDSNSGENLFTKATIYAGLEDAEQSTKYFLEAMGKGVYPSDILVDKNYDFMRNHPRYMEILAVYNLQTYSHLNK